MHTSLRKKCCQSLKTWSLALGLQYFFWPNMLRLLLQVALRLTLESAMSIANSIVALWQAGSYQPDPQYPFTLEETLADLRDGVKAQNDYSEYFQPFAPTDSVPPRGAGQVAGGIVQHPKTHLWQIWMMLDGPCEFLGAYHDSATAQKMLEEIINTTRQGNGPGMALSLYQKVVSQGDGKPQQLPFDMMAYLLEHLKIYTIEL